MKILPGTIMKKFIKKVMIEVIYEYIIGENHEEIMF